MTTYLSTCGVPAETGPIAVCANGVMILDAAVPAVPSGAPSAFAAVGNGFSAPAGMTDAAMAAAAVRPTVDVTDDFADRAASKQDKQRWTRNHVLGSPPWSHPVF